MKCLIRGLGTATPAHITSQDDALTMATEVLCKETRQERLLRMLYRQSGVEKRHTVLSGRFACNWKSDFESSGGPTTFDRMQMYQRYAGSLASESCMSALLDAGISACEMTHLVLVTCTGFGSPGVDVDLFSELGLKPTTQRIHVAFMGCHGTINGLRTVQGIIANDPHAKVLLCSVELCSLHYRMNWDDGIIGNALFADGSGAVVITSDHEEKTALWNIVGTGSCLISESTDEMSWNVGDYGFEMRLTSQVSNIIKANLKPWLTEWLHSLDHSLEEIGVWAVHPGGPKILDSVEEALGLSPEHLAVSREILLHYGNMSSATVLFVLDQYRTLQLFRPTVLLAFGPGLFAEATLLTAG